VVRPVALQVMHHGGSVVGGERSPVVVLEARARLRPGVLVAEAERMAELVPEHAREGIRRDVAEGARVDEDVAD
jgi:hypothetical protein